MARSYWIQKGSRENRTEEGTPYAVGVRVDWGLLRAGERRDCSGQALEAEGLNCLGCPFFSVARQGLVTGVKRAPERTACSGLRCRTEKGTPFVVGKSSRR